MIDILCDDYFLYNIMMIYNFFILYLIIKYIFFYSYTEISIIFLKQVAQLVKIEIFS